jgi:hypothetical protein
MKKIFKLFAILSVSAISPTFAGLITAVPGPDDQGGMLMPMVSIQATSGPASDPTAGIVNVSFSPPSVPVLSSLQTWSPNDWFAETAAWRPDLSSPEGIGGTPAANAGSGNLFNNQYGFMFMSMGSMMMANVPTGKALAIKLTSISSASMQSYNYGNASNRWDQVFPVVDSQVLWDGSMWHNYFTLPASALAGSYTASFEIFIANTPFTGTTGFAQYDAAALSALKDTNFTAATVDYTWNVVPEASSLGLFVLGVLALVGVLGRRNARA